MKLRIQLYRNDKYIGFAIVSKKEYLQFIEKCEPEHLLREKNRNYKFFLESNEGKYYFKKVNSMKVFLNLFDAAQSSVKNSSLSFTTWRKDRDFSYGFLTVTFDSFYEEFKRIHSTSERSFKPILAGVHLGSTSRGWRKVDVVDIRTVLV